MFVIHLDVNKPSYNIGGGGARAARRIRINVVFDGLSAGLYFSKALPRCSQRGREAPWYNRRASKQGFRWYHGSSFGPACSNCRLQHPRLRSVSTSAKIIYIYIYTYVFISIYRCVKLCRYMCVYIYCA